MCLAVPAKILSIDGEEAVVDYGGVQRTTNISMVDAFEGEYVLIHAGFAIEKMKKEEAELSLKEIRKMLEYEDS